MSFKRFWTLFARNRKLLTDFKQEDDMPKFYFRNLLLEAIRRMDCRGKR